MTNISSIKTSKQKLKSLIQLLFCSVKLHKSKANDTNIRCFMQSSHLEQKLVNYLESYKASDIKSYKANDRASRLVLNKKPNRKTVSHPIEYRILNFMYRRKTFSSAFSALFHAKQKKYDFQDKLNWILTYFLPAYCCLFFDQYRTSRIRMLKTHVIPAAKAAAYTKLIARSEELFRAKSYNI